MFKVKIVRQEAIQPKRITKHAAGLDCFAPYDFIIPSGTRMMINLGFAVELPPSTCGLLKSCSGLAIQFGLDVMAGVIDSDYRGEIIVLLFNAGSKPVVFKRGNKICQLIVVPILLDFKLIPFESDELLSTTYRGNAGLGAL